MRNSETQESKRVTLADVAQAAGVSVSTVSSVLRDASANWIGDATRHKVRRIADELRYQPNLLARGLRYGASGAIGLICAGLSNDYVSAVVEQLHRCAEVKDHHLVLTFFPGTDEQAITQAVRQIQQHMIGALFVLSPYQPIPAATLPAEVPVVLIDTVLGEALPRSSDRKVSHVRIDRAAGVEEATAALLRSGRRRVAMVVDLSDNATDGRARTGHEKHAGWRSAHTQIGLTAPEDLVFRVPLKDEWNINDGYDIGKMILRRRLQPDAIMFNNDRLAIGTMYALRDQGVRVPEEIAIVGYGDQPACLISPVPLASVGVDAARLAQSAIRLALHDKPRVATIQTFFVPRASTATGKSE